MERIDFWAVKRQIDREVERLGWSTEECIAYIKTHYNRSTRLVMNDAQLEHLLSRLQLMVNPDSEDKPVTRNRRRDRRRRR